MSSPSGAVGVIANPMSGRDVRRMVARASTTTPESKRDQIARAVVGAVAGGAQRVLVMREPFRISLAAVENLRLDAKIEAIDVGARLDAGDTTRAVVAMRAAGCGVLLVLGGDGTHRVVAGAWAEAPLVAVSTGTNNVFPAMVEATSAGAAAGLVSAGRVPLESVARRAKLVRVEIDGEPDDLAVIDAVLLRDDRVGNFLPYDPARIRRIVLARAEPAAVGVSPIGGLLYPCGAADDFGVEVECCGPDVADARELLVPISPGLYRNVRIVRAGRLAAGEPVTVRGPGVLAFDGDRLRPLAAGQCARLRVVRDGPWLIDVPAALRMAAERGAFVGRGHWHDAYDPSDDPGSDSGCC